MTVRKIIQPTTKFAKNAISATSSTAGNIFKLSKKTGGRFFRLASGAFLILPKTVDAAISSVKKSKGNPRY